MSKRKTNRGGVDDKKLRLEYVSPQDLKPHPLNWRKHPVAQRKAFAALKQSVGYVDAIIVSRRSMTIVDGHMRYEEALRNKEREVPVLFGDWTEEQEKQILGSKDPIALMAQTNADALAALTADNQKYLSRLSTEPRKSLERLGETLTQLAEDINAGEAPESALSLTEKKSRKPKESTVVIDPEEDHYDAEGIYETTIKEDVIFPIENAFGIPHLLPNLLCDAVPTCTWDRTPESVSQEDAVPYYCYSAGPNTIPNKPQGVLGFFTEDFRFEKCWNDSTGFLEYLQKMDFLGVCPPDFSGWADWPLAVRIHNLYRSRWCARFWQEGGIPVLPILQAFGDAEELADIVFGSLPQKIPVAMVQCRTREKGADYWQGFARFVEIATSNLKVGTLVFYGGEENGKFFDPYLPAKIRKNAAYIPAYLTKRRRKINQK